MSNLILSYKSSAVGMYQYKNHAPHNEYFVTHGPGFPRLHPEFKDDLRGRIKDNASLGFVVKCEFKYPLSHLVKYYPKDLDMSNDYDPWLYVERTFEFKRSRTGDLDSLVNVGLVNFKYSQRATLEEPKSVQLTQMGQAVYVRESQVKPTPEQEAYVKKELDTMNIDITIDNIKKIRLNVGDFEFVCTGENGQDQIMKNEEKNEKFYHNGSWPFWTYYYRNLYTYRFQSVLNLQHGHEPHATVQEYFVPEQYPRGY